MKVNGQLELAQLEQIADAAPALAPRGRMYMDISAPAAGRARVFDGTNWQELYYLSDVPANTSVVTQDSGKACTVDWATGLSQKVVLTDHALISFSNPQEGKLHQLTIVQAGYGPTVPVYNYRLNMPDQLTDKNASGQKAFYNSQASLNYGDSTTYSWLYVAGQGVAYATIPEALPIPATKTGTAVTGMSFSAWGDILFHGNGASPFAIQHRVYHYGGKPFISASNLSTPPTAAARIQASAFSWSGGFTCVASNSSPFIQAWGHDQINEPTGSAYANPGTLPTGAAHCIDIHPNGNYVAIGHNTSPFFSVYPISSAGFGTKLANPGTLAAGAVTSIAFSPHGDYLAVVSQSFPHIQVYVFDAVNGTIGGVVPNPTISPANGPGGNGGKAIHWHPTGDWIVVGPSTAPVWVSSFDRDAGSFGTQDQAAASGPVITSTQFSPCGNYLWVGMASAPFLTVYDFSARNLDTTVTFDGSAPTGQVNDIVIHPNGKYAYIGLDASPFLAIYPIPTKTRNYIRL